MGDGIHEVHGAVGGDHLCQNFREPRDRAGIRNQGANGGRGHGASPLHARTMSSSCRFEAWAWAPARGAIPDSKPSTIGHKISPPSPTLATLGVSVMNTNEIANDLVALCKAGKFGESGEKYWSE